METLQQQSSVLIFTKILAIFEKKQEGDDGAINIEFRKVSNG